MTDRILKLRDRLYNENNDAFFYERMPLLEQAYAIWKNEQTGRRYAYAFAYLLDHITLVLQDGELLVGTPLEIVPTEQQEEEYQRVISKPGNQFDMQGYFGFESLGLLQSSEWVERYAPEWFFSYGHHKYSIESVLSKGFAGIRTFISARLTQDTLTQEQRDFYENGIIICDGIRRFADRMVKFLLQKANAESDARRKIEILQMAENFRHVPMQPAQSFYEAVQTVWILQFINHNICGARDYAFGRMDQYLYPYFKSDLDSGKLTKEIALELIENLFIKMNEAIGYCVWFYKPKRTLANHSVQYVYISGQKDNGEDATNALSWIILEAVGELKIQQPSLYIHYHDNINPEFLHRAAEILKNGRCEPAFYNDSVVVNALTRAGIPEKDAKKFTHYGCCNINLDSMEDEIREIWNIMPKFLELAINNGHDLLTGQLLTAEISPLNTLRSIDDVYKAMMAHYSIALDLALAKIALGDEICREKKSFSFESLMLPDCLEQGIDMTRYTKYKHCNVHASGIATAGDSLYAIDRLVFKEKQLTLQQMVQILKNNWDGHIHLHQQVKNKFPKFGNDDDTVDQYAVRLANEFVKETREHSPIKGELENYLRILLPTFYSLELATDMGRVTAASADGRMSGETISENQSPTYGAAMKGPTAMLSSIAKLPLSETAGGGLNFSISRHLLSGDKGADILAQLIRGYFADGGLHMQIMVTDEKILEEAQKNPDKYRNLLVRVTGFSAYFVTLSPDVQTEIINRTKTASG